MKITIDRHIFVVVAMASTLILTQTKLAASEDEPVDVSETNSPAAVESITTTSSNNDPQTNSSTIEAPESSAEAPESSAETPESSAEAPENNAEAPENNAEALENNAEAPENNAEALENNAEALENNAEALENNAEAPEKAVEGLEKAKDSSHEASENETNVISEKEATEDPKIQPPLELLGSSVEPGEAALLKWAVEASFVDSSAPVPVLVVNGVDPGPTLCLAAAVHGDELNGIEVVRRVVHEIEPDKLSGAVIGVPIVNLQGFRRASRYLPDRRDLNRYFPGRVKGSYASRIAHSFFTNIVKHCDYLIDLHTGSLSRTNLPQIRANLLDPDVASLAEKMGSIVVLQSKGTKGTLRRAAADAGIPAVTLEAGAPNNLQKEAVEQSVKSVLSALSSLGLSKKPFWKRSEEPVFYQSTWIRARQGGILFSKVELGDSVKKDSVLGLLSNPITNKTTDIVSPLEGRVIGMALNQVMYPGFAAYHIGLKSSAVEATKPAQLILEEEITEDDLSLSETESVEASDQSDSEKTMIFPETTDPSETEKSPIEEMELPTIDNE